MSLFLKFRHDLIHQLIDESHYDPLIAPNYEDGKVQYSQQQEYYMFEVKQNHHYNGIFNIKIF